MIRMRRIWSGGKVSSVSLPKLYAHQNMHYENVLTEKKGGLVFGESLTSVGVICVRTPHVLRYLSLD